MSDSERNASHANDSAPPEIIAIVVSYNSSIDLPPCLAALQAQERVHLLIHVVDNASSDGSVERVRHEFPNVRVEANRDNVGFGRANNQVLDRGEAPLYALVNPDAILAPTALETCVDEMRRDPRLGIVATRLINPDGSLQPSCHAFLDLRNLIGETFGIHRILPGAGSLASLHMPWFAHDRVADVDWLAGAFLVVRHEMIKGIGAFDPEFFMYGEEMDLCRRARGAGWAVRFLPGPSVVHTGGVSSRPIAGAMFVENLKGRVRFLRNHRGPIVAATARCLIGISVLLRFTWREVEAAVRSLAGRPIDEPLGLDRSRFRAAMRWVARGFPL